MLATTNVTFVHGDGYKLQHIHVRFDHNEHSHYKLPTMNIPTTYKNVTPTMIIM